MPLTGQVRGWNNVSCKLKSINLMYYGSISAMFALRVRFYFINGTVYASCCTFSSTLSFLRVAEKTKDASPFDSRCLMRASDRGKSQGGIPCHVNRSQSIFIAVVASLRFLPRAQCCFWKHNYAKQSLTYLMM